MHRFIASHLTPSISSGFNARHPWLVLFLSIAFALPSPAIAQVILNEIHYHPVELPSFDTAGNPVFQDSRLPADFTEDVHEFVEIQNANPTTVSLAGWRLSGGIEFTFPPNASLKSGGFLVIAKNPSRIQTVYGIADVLGPYTGSLGNKDDTVILEDIAGVPVDSVRYRASFPWPNSADALGAGDDFTLLASTNHQYKGRSLERVSVSANSDDPANWLASPLAKGPSPGAANAVSRAVPHPIVIAFNAVQASDDAPILRANQAVRITCRFSSANVPGIVRVESFVDAIDGPTAFSEPRTTVVMTDLGQGQFTATLPGQPDRSIVRWRVQIDRGAGFELVFPRPDEAAIVPVGPLIREAWAAYFVTPTRTSSRPVYDVFVSSSDTNSTAFNGLNGLATMNFNITGNPKRVTSSASSGLPRETPHVPASARLWNGSVPAVFVENGQVRDAHLRYHGSRYNRNAGRNSFKLRFADTERFRDADSVFITDKSDYFSVCHGLYLNANLPISEVRWVDWYLNNNPVLLRLEQGEYNGDLLDLYHKRIADLNPGTPKEPTGEFYKDVGTIEASGEGPYDNGSGRRLLAAGPWSSLQRYEWTYTLQNHGWKGAKPIKDFFDGLWAARGDTPGAPRPNLPNLRAYLDKQLDVEDLLTSLSIATWMCPWDDTTQNHFLWRRANGRWNHILWDFDAMFGNGDTTGINSWIYLGESGTPPEGILGNNFRGPNWFKDSFFKAYRAEYNERLWVLNNTYLHPDNLKTLYYRNSQGTLTSYYNFINAVKAGFCEDRFASVNTQTGHAADGSDFLRPAKPTPASPLGGGTALPPKALTASTYTHTSGNTTGINAHRKSKWEIRPANGSYANPTTVVVSTNQLTSFPIPFADLQFGQSYFWRVTYFDTQDHPSLPSDEVSFAFGPRSSNQTLVAFKSRWKYDSSGKHTTPAWTQPGFNDTTWASGPGVLAFETPNVLPESIGTPLPDPRSLTPAGRTYYFRHRFNLPATPSTVSNLRLRHLIDDGCVIYLNGIPVHRYFMNEQPAYAFDAFANGGPGDANYQFADAIANTGTWSYTDPRPFLVQGDNVLAVEVHQVNNTSSDIVMGLELTATLATGAGEVVIHEVSANGAGATDWIELKNTTAQPKDISGFGLTDDILNPTRFVFPQGTVLPAGAYRVIDCNPTAPSSASNTGFGLDRNGQLLVLTSTDTVRDFVAFGPQARGYTIGRFPEGNGSFTLTHPTPNATNREVAALGSPSRLRINEWMASPAHDDDWFELFNTDTNPVPLGGLYLSDTPSSPQITQIPALSFIAGRDVSDFQADGSKDGGNHVDFKLSASGDQILLSDASGILDSILFSNAPFNTSRGRFPDGSDTLQDFPLTDSRGESNWKPAPVVINEIFTRSVPPAEDAIELFNPTAKAVDISGWWLSDDPLQRRKYQFPVGTQIPAGGFRVITEAQLSSGTMPFQFDSSGDDAVLTAVKGGIETGFRSQAGFGPISEGVSYGRVSTGTPAGTWKPDLWPQLGVTLGSPNAGPAIGPVVINEVHYHPADLPGSIDNTRDEFIELHNPSTQTIQLAGWRLKGGSDYTFPAGISIAPGEYLLLVGFDPVRSATLLAEFRTALGVSPATRIFGPYTPKMANDGASIEIAQPDSVLSLFVNRDQVRYLDYAPWPTKPDGSGSSLQRASVSILGNDPANWAALAPSPGKRNANQAGVLDTDGDGLPDDWEIANGLDKTNPADAALDADGDGYSNLEEYVAGTDPRDPASSLGISASLHNGQVRLQFTAQAGKSYTLQYRDTLAPGAWNRLSDIAPPGATQVITVDDPTGLPGRFYRLVTPRAP